MAVLNKEEKQYVNEFFDMFLNISEKSTVLELKDMKKAIIKHEEMFNARTYASMLNRINKLMAERREYLNGR